jgi:hypothetical protein
MNLCQDFCQNAPPLEAPLLFIPQGIGRPPRNDPSGIPKFKQVTCLWDDKLKMNDAVAHFSQC